MLIKKSFSHVNIKLRIVNWKNIQSRGDGDSAHKKIIYVYSLIPFQVIMTKDN